MRKRTLWLAALFLSGTAACMAQYDYFPLQLGNQWIYRTGNLPQPQTVTVEVTQTEIFQDRVYYLVKGLPPGEAWLRMSEEGTLYAWDSGQKQERVWVAFATPEGGSYETAISPCNRRATIASRSANYKGPVGDFTWALQIDYPPGPCMDAGITREFYLPYVGLVHRAETTIAGPRTYDLIYARLGGTVVISEPEMAFNLSLDKAVYTANLMPPVDPKRVAPLMTARLSLRHTQPEPLRLSFSSGQTYELILWNERGEPEYRWSDGKFFTQAMRSVDFPAGEQNWVIVIPLAAKDGSPLPRGSYAAEAWLTTTEGKIYAATVGFRIQYIY